MTLKLGESYPRAARWKTGILVVSDLFTRRVEAFPITEATSGRTLHPLLSVGFFSAVVTLDVYLQTINASSQDTEVAVFDGLGYLTLDNVCMPFWVNLTENY